MDHKVFKVEKNVFYFVINHKRKNIYKINLRGVNYCNNKRGGL